MSPRAAVLGGRGTARDTYRVFAKFIERNPGCTVGDIARGFSMRYGNVTSTLTSMTYQEPRLFEDERGRLYIDENQRGSA